MIEALENYQDKFDRLTQLKSMAEAEATLQKFGYSVEDILNMSDEAFQAFAKDYVNAIAGANSENDLFLQSLEKLSGIELTGVSDGLSNVAESASMAANAISGNGGASNGDKDSSEATNTQTNSSGESLNDAITTSTNTATTEIPKIANAYAGEATGDGEQSGSVLSAVQNVIDKIGVAESENEEGENAETLTGTIQDNVQYATSEKGIPAVIDIFDNLNKKIIDIVSNLKKAKILMIEISQLESGGGGSHTSAGGNTYGGGGHVKVNGSANANGNWSTGKEKNVLVGELAPELRVNSKDGTYEIVGQHGAEFIDTNEHDIIFNGEQTKQILKNGHINSRGKALSSGTLPHLRPLQEGDKMFDLIKKLNENNDLIQNDIIPPVNSIQKNAEIMARNINHVNNRNTTTQDINININGGINLQGVQDPDALAKAINQRLPNSLKQELFKRK